MEFADKRAVITGASSGIGRQIALDLARKGARTVLIARNRDRLDAVRCEIEKETGREPEVFTLDVGDGKAYQGVARQILERGPVHLLINNAGWGFSGPFLAYRTDEVESMMKTNYLGAVHGIAAFAPGMKEAGGGHIVNIASVAGLIATPYQAAYCATKHALVALGRALRLELAPHGVRVITICPGVVETPFFDAHPSFSKMRKFRRGPILTPEEVSRAVLRALRRNRPLVMVPRLLWAAVLLSHLLPGPFSLFMAWYARKVARDFAPK